MPAFPPKQGKRSEIFDFMDNRSDLHRHFLMRRREKTEFIVLLTKQRRVSNDECFGDVVQHIYGRAVHYSLLKLTFIKDFITGVNK